MVLEINRAIVAKNIVTSVRHCYFRSQMVGAKIKKLTVIIKVIWIIINKKIVIRTVCGSGGWFSNDNS